MTAEPAAGPSPVQVTLPAQIDVTNAGIIREQIAAAALTPGITIVIADMTGTIFCDSTGVRELLTARDRAARNGVGLRLLRPTPAVIRVLELTGADRLLPICCSADEAMNASASAAGEGSGQQAGAAP